VGLVCGSRPQNVTLRRCLTLRFDESGNLLSRLPAPVIPSPDLPRFRVHAGTVTLRQQGRPDLVVRGACAELFPEEKKVTLAGSSTTRNGHRVACGNFDPATGTLEGTVKTGVVHLTHAELAALPFVPAETWKQVQCEGDTSAEIGIRLCTRDRASSIQETHKNPVHYRVTLVPRRTKVLVTAIGLTAENALGRVIVEDGVVRLDGVEGGTAGGTISTSAVLDFRRPASDLQSDLGARKLELQQLPEMWKLRARRWPAERQGRVACARRERSAATAGRGEGEITGVSVLGFEAREPIRLRIVADGDGFHFDVPMAAHIGASLSAARKRCLPLFSSGIRLRDAVCTASAQ
jgi:hypothetical protein